MNESANTRQWIASELIFSRLDILELRLRENELSSLSAETQTRRTDTHTRTHTHTIRLVNDSLCSPSVHAQAIKKKIKNKIEKKINTNPINSFTQSLKRRASNRISGHSNHIQAQVSTEQHKATFRAAIYNIVSCI